MIVQREFIADDSGGSAAEFGLVLPLVLLFLFGIIDTGRFMWEYNKAEKATQMGARYAAVTNMVPTTLATTSFVVAGSVAPGDPIPSTAFSGTRCRIGSCNTAPTSVCPTANAAATTDWGYADAAFTNVVKRIKTFKQDVSASQVVLDYNFSGLGYAGDPTGPAITPLVTVRLCGMTFQPLTTILFGGSISMGALSYTLTMEDGAGTVSN